MGVVVRQSIKSVIITVVGAIMGIAVTILSMRYFPKIEYGFTQNLQKIGTQLSLIGVFGFNYAVLIQSHKYPPGHSKRNAYLTLCAIVPIVFTLAICGLLFLFKDSFLALYKQEDRIMMKDFFLTFPILTILTVGIYWLSSYLQAIQKNALQNFASEIVLRIGYIALIVAFALGWINYTQFIYAFACIFIIPLAYLYYIAKRLGNLKFTLKIQLPLSEIKETFRFSGYHMLTAVSTVLIFQLDAILLGPLSAGGLEAIAVYAVATLAVSLLRTPTRVIATTAVPSFSQHYLAGDLKGLKLIFERSCIIMQILAVGAFAFILLNIDTIQHLINQLKSGYDAIGVLLIILMIGQVADMITGFNYQILSVSKYYRFNFWISILLLVIVFVLNYIFIQDYGIYGAAWATTIGLTVFNILKSWFVWKKLKMQPFSKKSLLVFLFALLTFAIAWIIPNTGFYYLDVVLKNLVFGGLFLGLLLKGSVSEELNGVVMNLIKNKKLF